MAGSINRAQILGNLGRDPEIRRSNDGKPIANMSIATSETWTDKGTGERKERVQWHRVVCFNEGLCGVIEKYLKKGSKVYVEGSIETRKWTDKDGVEKYSTEIVMRPFGSTLIMLDKKNGGGGAASEDDYGTTRTRDDRSRSQQELDDEIPF